MSNDDKLGQLEGLKRLKEAGKPVPFLDKMPDVLPEAEKFWIAWNSLQATRGWNEHRALGVSYVELLAYVRYHGWTDEADLEDLDYIVRHLDNIYLKHVAAKKRKEPPPEPGPKRSSRRR